MSNKNHYALKKKHFRKILFHKGLHSSTFVCILGLLYAYAEHYIYPAFKEIILQLYRSKSIWEIHIWAKKNCPCMSVCVHTHTYVFGVGGRKEEICVRDRRSYAKRTYMNRCLTSTRRNWTISCDLILCAVTGLQDDGRGPSVHVLCLIIHARSGLHVKSVSINDYCL